jgi:hypothetical protein
VGGIVTDALFQRPTAAGEVDHDLATRARSGDTLAFEALLQPRMAGLGRFALAVVGDAPSRGLFA